MTAGLVVNVAFNDWFHNPIITSVDSIAAPIDLIQFPTITVCHEDTRRRLLDERFWDKSQKSFRRFLAVFSAQTVNAAQIRELPNQRNHFFEARVNF